LRILQVCGGSKETATGGTVVWLVCLSCNTICGLFNFDQNMQIGESGWHRGVLPPDAPLDFRLFPICAC
jgi:hypothetical protein